MKVKSQSGGVSILGILIAIGCIAAISAVGYGGFKYSESLRNSSPTEDPSNAAATLPISDQNIPEASTAAKTSASSEPSSATNTAPQAPKVSDSTSTKTPPQKTSAKPKATTKATPSQPTASSAASPSVAIPTPTTQTVNPWQADLKSVDDVNLKLNKAVGVLADSSFSTLIDYDKVMPEFYGARSSLAQTSTSSGGEVMIFLKSFIDLVIKSLEHQKATTPARFSQTDSGYQDALTFYEQNSKSASTSYANLKQGK